MESLQESNKRRVQGLTICNRVFTEALEIRAKQYDEMIEKERQAPNPDIIKISTLETKASAVRPARFSEGPLLFGLRHQIVQDTILEKHRSSSSIIITPSITSSSA